MSFRKLFVLLTLFIAGCSTPAITPSPEFIVNGEVANLIIEVTLSEDYQTLTFSMDDNGRGGTYELGGDEFVNNEFHIQAPLVFIKSPNIFPSRNGKSCGLLESIDYPDQSPTLVQWRGKYTCP